MSLTAGLGLLIFLITAVGAGLGTVRLRMLREHIRRLEAETVTDPLTGAFNREFVVQRLPLLADVARPEVWRQVPETSHPPTMASSARFMLVPNRRPRPNGS